MSTQRINAVEKDLEKFIKFLAIKATQVIVQSRLGEKIQTQCNPLSTGNDWFNIVIQDHPDVLAETKRVLALSSGDSILQRLPLSIEISLKTVEGDQMILEVWSMDLTTQSGQLQDEKQEFKIDNQKTISTSGGSGSEQQVLKAAHAIYNRMGILLKSIISLTRATPAYKLSRRQCSDSYGIYYRIFLDRPQLHSLGEGYKYVKIGQLNTIVGTLCMSMFYRTKMTISPTATQILKESSSIMLKSDHFRPNDSTLKVQSTTNVLKKLGAGGVNIERKINIDKPLRPGAFVEMGKIRQYTEDDYVLPETPPFEWLVRQKQFGCINGGSEPEFIIKKNDVSEISFMQSSYNKLKYDFANNNNDVKNLKDLESDFSIKSLLIPTAQSSRQHSTTALSDDDHLLKELNFPFASPTSHVNDLAKFYRDCYHAPPLCGLSEIQSETVGYCAATVEGETSDLNVMDDLSRQLEQFETSLEDYDKLVLQLGLSTSSSTGSHSSGGLQMSS